MNTGERSVWESLIENGSASFQAGKMGLSFCENCEDYTEDNVRDDSKGFTGDIDTWECPNPVGYCIPCGEEK
tara:strand:+ start:289 stop:504 length:216 start_codon:yes stop_codon:yes gene_type:complete